MSEMAFGVGEQCSRGLLRSCEQRRNRSANKESKRREFKGLLLAGGHGTRLRPLTYTGNKHMLPIANKPMLMYGFDQLRMSGVTKIGVVLGPLQEGIREALGDGSKFDLEITYIDQPDPRGIAHAVLISRDFLGESPFIVHLGDNLLKDSVAQLASEFQESGADAMVVVSRVKDPSRFGVVEIQNGKIVRLIEKPNKFVSDLALAGVYFFRSTIYSAIEKLKPSWRNELEITDALQNLLGGGGRIIFHEVSGWWKDTGRPEDILDANRLVLNDLAPSVNGNVSEGVTLSGSVTVGEGTTIDKGVILKGPSVIGRDSRIDGKARVGPFASIGNRVKISRATIENSIILDGSTIDCNERIVNSLIGKNSIITSQRIEASGKRFIVGESTFVTL